MEHKVVPNQIAYTDGYNDGLKLFCVPQRAFQLGMSGHSYRNVCEGKIVAEHKSAYEMGRDIYRVGEDIKGIKSTISAKESRIKEIDTSLHESRIKLLGSVYPADKLAFQQRIAQLENEKRVIREEIGPLRRSIDEKTFLRENMLNDSPYR